MTRYCWKHGMWIVMALWIFAGAGGLVAEAASCKVLAVMSYHEEHLRMADIKEGIDQALADECELTYVYLDTIRNPQNADANALEAYRLYQTLQPDGVIAAHDQAQESFVIPYLKGKVETPVMFSSIAASPETYGYPASNVSGIADRQMVKDSIIFARQIDPSIATIGVLLADGPAVQAHLAQIARGTKNLPVTVLEPTIVSTFDELALQLRALKDQCDALYVGILFNLLETEGMSVQDLFALIMREFGKATLSPIDMYTKFGLLCSVKNFGQEHGRVAAEMLQQAMHGTPIAELPITYNQYGQRILNVETAKALGLRPLRSALAGVELVKTVQE